MLDEARMALVAEKVVGQFSGLPDGEATVSPLEGSTQGRLVSPYCMDKIGLVDEPFSMEVRDGWITSIEGGKQAQQLSRLLDDLDRNARRFASQFAMGTNPGCRVVPIAREVSKRLGTVHLALGDNITLGGAVEAGLHMDIVLLDPTVTVDGTVILEGGKLNL